MRQSKFLQIAGFMIALLSLTTPSTWAQTTVTLPAACQNCPSSSTNGTGVVSSYGAPACTANTINGTMTAGTAVSGVTMSLYANVTTLGTYNLSATQNGVNFSGSGTFTALGCQLVTLTASGTPTTAGATTWVTNSTPVGIATGTVAAAGPAFPAGYVACDGVTTVVQDVMSVATGRLWMDRNLGASRVALGSGDYKAWGDYYQWGRFADGHQCLFSPTTTTLATTAVPNAGNPWDGLVITGNGLLNWLTPDNNTLWQGVNGTNNPCPSGYRLPTIAEWTSEGFLNINAAFGSQLKLPAASGSGIGQYWSSSASWSGAQSQYIIIQAATQYSAIQNSARLSVRCIKN